METKTGFVVEVWHASKIKIQEGSTRFFLHLLKEAPEEVARFSGHGACVLSTGVAVTFSRDAEGGIYDVKFDIPTPSFEEFEDSQVVDWRPSTRSGGCGYGFSQRGCRLGCRLYTREDDVTTLGHLKVGSWINHSIAEQSDGRIKAAKISIYQGQGD